MPLCMPDIVVFMVLSMTNKKATMELVNYPDVLLSSPRNFQTTDRRILQLMSLYVLRMMETIFSAKPIVLLQYFHFFLYFHVIESFLIIDVIGVQW